MYGVCIRMLPGMGRGIVSSWYLYPFHTTVKRQTSLEKMYGVCIRMLPGIGGGIVSSGHLNPFHTAVKRHTFLEKISRNVSV